MERCFLFIIPLLQVRLAVRLHRGLYLEMFAGKNVTLQVHLPGCGCLLSFPGKVNNEAFFYELEIRIWGTGF